MSKIAIDIVLLPPDDVMDICIDLCKKFPDYNNDRVSLNKINNLPHASLFMGIIEENEIDKIINKIESITKEYKSLNLTIPQITYKKRPDDTESYFLEIEKTKELQNLHKQNTKNNYIKQF